MIPGWLDEIEAEVLACVRARGGLSARYLAARLAVSESLAVGYICLFGRQGPPDN